MTSPTSRTPQEILARLTALLVQGNLQNNLVEIQQLQTLLTQLALGGATAQGDGATAVAERGVNVGGSAGDINTGIKIVNNQYTGSIPRKPTEIRRVYLRVLAALVSRLPLRAFDEGQNHAQRDGKEPTLINIYTALDTRTTEHLTPSRNPDMKRKASQRVVEPFEVADSSEARILRVLEVAQSHPRLVLLGEPGSGKSTVVNHLICCLATAQTQPKLPWLKPFLEDWPTPLRTLLPVRIVLREFDVWVRGQGVDPAKTSATAKYLVDFVAHTLEQQ